MIRFRQLTKTLFFIFGTSVLCTPSWAIDTDIFLLNSGPKPAAKNILLWLDNGANWTNSLTSETAPGASNAAQRSFKANIAQALHIVLNCLPAVEDDDVENSLFNVGIMGYSKSVNGGKIHKAVQPFTTGYRLELQQYLYEIQPKDVFPLVPVPEADGSNACLLLDYVDPAGSTKKIKGVTTTVYDTWIEDAKGASAGGSDSNVPVEDIPKSTFATALHEAYLYYKGLLPRSGPSDGGLSDSFFDPEAVTDGDPDLTYAPPSSAGGCGGTYVILLGGANNPDNSEDATAKTLLDGLGGDTSLIPLPTAPTLQGNMTDEYSRFLNKGIDLNPDVEGNQGITTYVVDVFDPDNLSAADEKLRPFMESIAVEGGGKRFTGRNAAEVAGELATVFAEILEIDSVFAAAALPVSAALRGVNENQVYMGVFRPAQSARWPGNLKAYTLGVDANFNVRLVDANTPPNPVATQDDLAAIDVRSFWTTPSSYWAFSPSSFPSLASDSPDGSIVEKGGIAQQIRELPGGIPSRNVLTCNSPLGIGCPNGTILTDTLHQFDASSISVDDKARLCSGSVVCSDSPATETARMINWLRGMDVEGVRTNDVPNTDPRPYLHGDVLHSKPAVVNFNRKRTGDPCVAAGTCDDIVVFYGTNAGSLHAVQGGLDQNQSGGLPTAGTELWSFIAPEFFGELGQLYDEQSLGSTTVGRNIYFDGSITVYKEDNGGGGPSLDQPDGRYNHLDGDKVYLFVSLRRGGDVLYAIDVSNPVAPKMLWSKRGPFASGALGSNGTNDELSAKVDASGVQILPSAGYGELGQTWSAPKVAFVKGFDLDGNNIRDEVEDRRNPLLIFGKGYSPLSDDDLTREDDQFSLKDNLSGTAPIGTGIMVVDATNGNVLWQVGPNKDFDDFSKGPSQILNLSRTIDPTDPTSFVVSDTVYNYQEDMIHSVPSDLALVDRGVDGTGGKDPKGFTDYIYFGDTGGQVWKIDLTVRNLSNEVDPSLWTVTKLADLGKPNDPENARRFLFPPDVVLGKVNTQDLPTDSCGAFDAILIGSGNRENPKGTDVSDRVYLIKDHGFPNNYYQYCYNGDPAPDGYSYNGDRAVEVQTGPNGDGDPYLGKDDGDLDDPDSKGQVTTADGKTVYEPDLEGDFYDITDNPIQATEQALIAAKKGGTAAEIEAASKAYNLAKASFDQANGWVLQLAPGEKVVSSSLTVNGTLIFSTNTAETAALCGSALGKAKTYVLDFFTGGAAQDQTGDGLLDLTDRFISVGEGLPPDPTHFVVDIDNKKYEGVLVGTDVITPPGTGFLKRKKTHWYHRRIDLD